MVVDLPPHSLIGGQLIHLFFVDYRVSTDEVTYNLRLSFAALEDELNG
jgi:hypothetical protein